MPTNHKSKKKQLLSTIRDIQLRYVILALLLLGAIISFVVPPAKMVADTNSGAPGKTPEITDGMIVEQNFTVDRDYSFFGLYFPNYLNFFNEGTLHIALTDSQKQVNEFEYNASQMLNESYFYIHSSLRADEDYSLKIWVDDIPKEKVFTFSTIKIDDETSEEPMVIDGKAYNESLLMTFVYEKKDYFIIWYFVIAIILMLIYMILFPKKEDHAKK